MMVVAISIKTDSWVKVIKLLLGRGWNHTYKYNEIDAGIDFDLIVLQKDEEEIIFGWDNWFEGEIMCQEFRLNYIEQLLGEHLKIGQPENLKPEILKLYLK